MGGARTQPRPQGQISEKDLAKEKTLGGIDAKNPQRGLASQ